ncbi:MAG: hypothetical protein DCF25_05365 [Leptolyngbya foveolarum]|uniref:Uncharacterized protein n=1 Tax=Leptolyngbya foveolarum TaxID=47253 RepID=A0A2W4WFR2_9CYAN|nr:MAG: hypothetical protein DCF25_05365 [Leptolyngbya foveolarum]
MKKPVLWVIALLIVSLSSCSPSLQSEPASPNELPVPSTSVPPPPPAGAFLGKISPEVLTKINHLPVMAPAYIPSDFVLADYRLDGLQSYGLIYRDPKNQCFAIEYRRQPSPPENTDGLTTQSFDSPAFGAAHDLYYSPADKADQPSQLFSQWLTNTDGSYRLVGATTIAQNYPAQPPCQNVSPVEASKIVISIVDLTASPTE